MIERERETRYLSIRFLFFSYLLVLQLWCQKAEVVLLKDAKVVIATTHDYSTRVFQKLHAVISFLTLVIESLNDIPLAFDVVHFSGFPGAIRYVFPALIEGDAWAFFISEIVCDCIFTQIPYFTPFVAGDGEKVAVFTKRARFGGVFTAVGEGLLQHARFGIPELYRSRLRQRGEEHAVWVNIDCSVFVFRVVVGGLV